MKGFCQSTLIGDLEVSTSGNITSQPKGIYLQKKNLHPGQVVQLVEASSYALKGCRFDSWSGHIPRLWV